MLVGYYGRSTFSEIFRLDEGLWVSVIIISSILCPVATILLILREERDRKISQKKEEPIPSTPYQYFLHLISVTKWNILVCILCMATLTPLAIFAQDELTFHVNDMVITRRNTGPFLVRGLLLAYMFCLVVLLLAFKEVNMPYKRLNNEVEASINRGTLRIDQNPTRESLLHRVARTLGLQPPTFFIAEKLERWMPTVSFSLAGPKEDSKIVIEKNYLHSLTEKELEGVLAHELWHTEAAYTEVLLTAYERGYFFCFIGLALLLTCCLIGIFSVWLASEMVPWPYLLTNEYGMPRLLLSNPVLFAVSASPEIFGVLLIIRSLVINPKLFIFMATDPLLEEYFADSMGALTTQQPRELVRGILKEFNASMPTLISVSLTEHSNMLQPALFKRVKSPILRNRIKNLLFIDGLLKREWSFRVEKNLKGYSLFDFFGLNLKLYFSPFSRMLGQMDREKIKRIYGFILSNSNKFNIRQCAKRTDSSLAECFVVLACLLMAKRVS